MDPITTINRTIESILSNEKITLKIKQDEDSGSLMQITKPTDNVSANDSIYSTLIEPNLVRMTLCSFIFFNFIYKKRAFHIKDSFPDPRHP